MSRKIVKWLLATVAPLAVACGGGGSGSADGGDSAQGVCQVTLSGALSGTHPCFQPPVASWMPSSGLTTLVITSDGSPQKGSLNIVSTNSLLGAPATATYTDGDATLYVWSIAIREEATMKTWAASGITGIPNAAATYSLSISSLGVPTGTADSQVYPAHGSQHVKTTGDPLSRASGEVTMDVTF